MGHPYRRCSTVVLTVLSLGIGSAVWAQEGPRRLGVPSYGAAPNASWDAHGRFGGGGMSMSGSRCGAGCCRGGSSRVTAESPVEPSVHPPARSAQPTRPTQSAPRDLRVLAAQLEVAAEVAADTIDLALPSSRMSDGLRTEAGQVVTGARSFRTSVEQKAAVERLRRDFEAVAKSFGALARPVQQYRNALVDRSMIRVDQTLAEIGKTLAPGASDSSESAHMPSGSMPHHPSAPHAHQDAMLNHSSTHHHATPSEVPAPTSLDTASGTNPKPAAPRLVIPDEVKGISLLPLEDQAAALAQKTCPITGGKLGAMGKPIKVDVGNHSVFVCCEGCIEKVKSPASASAGRN